MIFTKSFGKIDTHLMQFEAHSDSGCHHLLQQVQISEHPLVFGGDAEVAFEQGVETIQERLQTEIQEEKKRWREKKGFSGYTVQHREAKRLKT